MSKKSSYDFVAIGKLCQLWRHLHVVSNPISLLWSSVFRIIRNVRTSWKEIEKTTYNVVFTVGVGGEFSDYITVHQRFNMEVDLQSLFGLHVYSLAETPQFLPSSRIWTRITRALLVSKDRRHLFVTPCCPRIKGQAIISQHNTYIYCLGQFSSIRFCLEKAFFILAALSILISSKPYLLLMTEFFWSSDQKMSRMDDKSNSKKREKKNSQNRQICS